MNETLSLVLALATGIVLGTIFFGGLWWTVRKSVSSKLPALWLSGSLLLRMSIVITGFYFVGRGHWERLLACLIGFIAARLIVTWLTRVSEEKQPSPEKESNHAS
ncbi:MAG: N-ATPase subunit AtpR [Victivallaceae bacterium]